MKKNKEQDFASLIEKRAERREKMYIIWYVFTGVHISLTTIYAIYTIIDYIIFNLEAFIYDFILILYGIIATAIGFHFIIKNSLEE